MGLTKNKYCDVHGYLKENELSIEKTGRIRCLYCKKESDARYRANNRKELCEKNKVYKKNNKDIVNAWNRKDREQNPEKYKEYARKNREKMGQYRNVVEISRVRGITPDQYKEMLAKQENKCAICKKEETRKKKGGGISALSLDHNHETNKVRQFLCFNCNALIGLLKESDELIDSAINYLTRHKQQCQK